VRLSAVRLAGGCSGSFLSAKGLIMTNHHCASRCIEQLSSAKKDFVASGFYAKTEKEEVKCPEIEINQLVAISDVTERMVQATRGLDGARYNEANKAEQSKIEKECATGDDVRCDVVTLYHDGRYTFTGRATRTCGSSSPPSSSLRSSEAIRTISCSRATTSTSRSCAFTRTTSRSKPISISNGRRPARRRATSRSWLGTPGPPTEG
jgi:hypothetical protein